MSMFKIAGTTEHEFARERLSSYLDGELTPRERETVAHHLESCPACQWELDTLTQTIQWTQELTPLQVPRVFTIPIPAEPARAPTRRWSFLPVMQGATALIALLFVFAVVGDLVTGPGGRWGASEVALQQEAPPSSTDVAIEVTMEVAAADEVEAPAEPEQAVEKIVIETVVVEREVTAGPTQAPVAEGISPTLPMVSGEARAPEATPEPPSDQATYESPAQAEVEEAAAPQAEPTTLDAVAAMAEGEAVPELTEEGPIAGGGEQALTLSEPSPLISGTEPGANSAAMEAALAQAGEREGSESRTSGESGVDWLRVVQVSLGGMLLLLAAATILLTIERRRAR